MTKRKKLTKKELKEKQAKTLSNMKKNREIDSNCLRDLITKKLKWSETEKEKGLETIKVYQDKIKNFQNQIEIVKKQILRIEGMQIFIKQLLKEKEEK